MSNNRNIPEKSRRVVMLKKLKLSTMSLKRKSFKIVRLNFNFYNITTLDLILQDILKIFKLSLIIFKLFLFKLIVLSFNFFNITTLEDFCGMFLMFEFHAATKS